MKTAMTNWFSGNLNSKLAVILSILSLILAAGYYGGRAVASASTCSAIEKAFQGHRETVYDPATDSVTVMAYQADNGYEQAPLSFRADFALQECGGSILVTAHVKALRRDYRQIEASFCESLKRVIAGEEPVPVKNGERMNMEAARNYVATRCSGMAQMPETR